MPSKAQFYIRESALISNHDQWAWISHYMQETLQPQGIERGYMYTDKPEARRRDFKQRPAASRCIAALNRGDHLVTRMSAFRNHDDFVRISDLLAARGAQLHIAGPDDPPSAEDASIRMELLADLADAEWERASERASARYAECRAKGKAIGKPALGMKWAGPRGRRRQVPDKIDQKVMEIIRELSRHGNTLDQIYFALLLGGITRSSGREWSRTTIWSVAREVSTQFKT